MAKTIVGLYDRLAEAQAVVRDLVASGFAQDEISLVANDANSDYAQYMSDETGVGSGTVTGISMGAVVGGLTGLLTGLGALALPGIGPVVAAGPLLGALAGAGVGAAAGSLIGTLVDVGIPEAEAGYYAEGIRRGGVLVVVTTHDERVAQAVAVLNRHGAVDLRQRVPNWRSQGWTRFDDQATPWTSSQVSQEREFYGVPHHVETQTRQRADSGAPQAIPGVESEIRGGRREFQQGGAQVGAQGGASPMGQEVRLREERPEMIQPLNRSLQMGRLGLFEEGTIELSETMEQPVITKHARVVEEISIYKDVHEHEQTVRGSVRRTDVSVERFPGTAASFESFDADFRAYHTSAFPYDRDSYDRFVPAYRYGYNLANDRRFNQGEWTTVAPDAQRYWEGRNPGTWDHYKGLVEHAWTKVCQRHQGRQ